MVAAPNRHAVELVRLLVTGALAGWKATRWRVHRLLCENFLVTRNASRILDYGARGFLPRDNCCLRDPLA